MSTATPSVQTPRQVRDHLVHALRAEVTGPQLPDEIIPQRPDAWYLAGFLAPKGVPLGAGAQMMLVEGLAENATASGFADDTGDDAKPPRKPPRPPSSFGLSALVPAAAARIDVRLSWGAYRPLNDSEIQRAAQANGIELPELAEEPPTEEVPDDEAPGRATPRPRTKRSWWQRTPVELPAFSLALKHGVTRHPVPGQPGLWITLRVTPAPNAIGLDAGCRVVSVFLSNHRPAAGVRRQTNALFQASLRVGCAEGFVPRHNEALKSGDEPDLWRADVQYRNHAEWAVGHNVATAAETTDETKHRVDVVRTEWLPTAQVHRMKADKVAGVTLSMKTLAALPDVGALALALGAIVPAYVEWISAQRPTARGLADAQRASVADGMLDGAEQASERIQAGLDLLASDPQAFLAFRLANDAMARAGHATRGDDDPQWYLFQLAFLLLNIRGVVLGDHADRRTVELLFFPTGGGKTEAYFGVAAFTMVLRRLRHADSPHGGAGVTVLLRYTLRLLTLDQLERAATLTCALEVLRREREDLGIDPFSIGLWVGAKATPNRLKVAKRQNQQYWAQPNHPARNLPCPLTACPWCHTPFEKSSFAFPGTAKSVEAMHIYCANIDTPCPFSADAYPEGTGLPLHVVDEQIYTQAPTFLVGTVDKFASLPWRGPSGALFGRVKGRSATGFVPMSSTGKAKTVLPPPGLLPPALIIQDELHLITGPLGTMVGLYEVAIEALCRDPEGRAPKVIASTATARRSGEQAKALFGRTSTHTFPPPGPDADDSFFAKTDHDPEKSRLYVGIAAGGKNLKAALVRVYSTLLGAAFKPWQAHDEMGIAPKDNPADGYCSLVGYFNNLRELGGATRLVQEQVAPRVQQLVRRKPIQMQRSPLFARRYLNFEVHEMTSRLSGDQIRNTRDAYNRPFDPKTNKADVLLASSMISVGVDISRLGLMVVTGQPRTIAEYIQATSRVGRRIPGLVVTVHNLFRPRDRSHYERFTAFHEAFYRDVEAATLTPFSGRAMDRGLTGAALAYARHAWPKLSSRLGVNGVAHETGLADELAALFAERVKALVGPGAEAATLAAHVTGRVKHIVSTWSDVIDANDKTTVSLQWSPWEGKPPPALLRGLDETDLLDEKLDLFRAPTSMRDVEPAVHLWVNRRPGSET
jgi:hypothetical protein